MKYLGVEVTTDPPLTESEIPLVKAMILAGWGVVVTTGLGVLYLVWR